MQIRVRKPDGWTTVEFPDEVNEIGVAGGKVDDQLCLTLTGKRDDGITLLDVEVSRGVPIWQSLVLDYLLLHDGPAFWVDPNGHVTTTTLAQIAPSQGCSTESTSHADLPPTSTTAPSVISRRQ